ncbi:MAG TPA: DUF2934 domain-containing protein [Candidatus Competibacter sp.]|nr:DUF2934 domain-containing protein [Candidatus Competibacter sp.]
MQQCEYRAPRRCATRRFERKVSNDKAIKLMENDLEHEIRNFAYDMWRSAGNEFGRALDFWVMAEQMVIEITADSARRASAAAASVIETAAAWPSALRALYLYRIRELAHCMWSTSTEQRDRSMDYWLAAEKHLRLLTESATRVTSASLGQEEALIKMIETFSPANYLEQIRETAYQLWETAGRQYGSALDFWLAAETKILDSLTSNGPAATASKSAAPPGRPKRSPKQRSRQQAKK